MSRTENQYEESTIQKALLYLNLNGKSYKDTERDTGIPESTLRRWAAQYPHFLTEVAWALDHELRNVLKSIVQKLLDKLDLAIPEVEIKNATDYKQLFTALGISLDKLRIQDTKIRQDFLADTTGQQPLFSPDAPPSADSVVPDGQSQVTDFTEPLASTLGDAEGKA